MVTANTIVHCQDSELDRFLAYDASQHPVVLQIGGSSPELCARAAQIATPYNFDAINLNCGCPSDRVAGAGCFGAALMEDPALVADCCAAIAQGGEGIPVTVKCRIGIVRDKSLAAEVNDEAT